MTLLFFLFAHSTATIAQKAAAPVTARPVMPAPEKAVVFELNMPWRGAQSIVKGKRAQLYSLERGEAPKFRVVDPDANFAWLYRPRLRVNVDQYPIVHMKYRASNLAGELPHVLRLALSQDGSATFHLFSADKIQADGKEHEVTQDLRELNASGAVYSIAFCVFAGSDGNAALDVLDLSFHAPDDAAAAPYDDGSSYTITVKTPDGQPVKGARVTLDYERRNFAIDGTTDENGTVTLGPAKGNEADQHMLAVTGDGFVPTLVASEGLAESLDVNLVPGSFYGGIAKDESSQPLAGARVELSIDPRSSLASAIGYPLSDSVVSDADGKWTSTIAFPADESAVHIVAIDASGQSTTIASSESKVAAPAVKSKSASAAGKPATKTATTKPALPDLVKKVDDTQVVGTLTGIEGGNFRIKPSSGEPIDVAIADVSEVVFRASTQPTTKPASGTPFTPQSAASNQPAPARPQGARPTAANASPSKPGEKKKPAPPAGAWQFMLDDEDVLYGKVERWADRKITLKSASLNEAIELPIDAVHEIWIATPAKIAKARALNVSADVQDVAYVAKDQDVVSVSGIVDGIEGESLLFTFNDQQRKIALNRLVGIKLAGHEPAAADADDGGAPKFEFRQTLVFASGESLGGQLKSMKDDVIEIAITGINSPIHATKGALESIRIRNGKLVYLSDLAPVNVEQTPYFDRVLPFRVDVSLAGTPIVLKEGPTTRGVSVPSRTVLKYDVGGRFDEFKTRVGFQLPEGRLGRASVRVLGDDAVLFENADVRGDQPPIDVQVKLAGVKTLTLEVDFGQGQDVGDWVVFAEPRLLRQSVE